MKDHTTQLQMVWLCMSPTTFSQAGKSVHTALVGRTCEAFFEQKWYNGALPFGSFRWTDPVSTQAIF